MSFLTRMLSIRFPLSYTSFSSKQAGHCMIAARYLRMSGKYLAKYQPEKLAAGDAKLKYKTYTFLSTKKNPTTEVADSFPVTYSIIFLAI
ncbi:hypothetical protein HZF08_15815 [Paenibacillus sp. CGMCC 1.16610]|uniref:Uncharacterized protein n=1 Tax=Paenibacillus anseongense TaxID=2682845 RepID=A0ABW9UJM4_9BACL|nr:hypothetical protein [Paenibacillus sp. CGMCC 1.16610]MVQ39440.1 hypothetical protein [Paenibacillus anseongense]